MWGILPSLVIYFLLHQASSILLENNWSVSNANKSIELHGISIPSGIYSDLENAGNTGSILSAYNDIDLRWIGNENWTYSLEFNLKQEELDHEFLTLTFNGLDTLTNIYFDDEHIGSTNNMFIRYSFNVKQQLTDINTLRIEFNSPVAESNNLYSQLTKEVLPECTPPTYNGECHINMLRKMQASFGWDWGLAAPSMGIWKSVVLEVYDSAIIRHITTYQLIESELWILNVVVHMETGLEQKEYNGTLSCQLINDDNYLIYNVSNVLIESNEFGEYTTELKMEINKSLVNQWWPNGYGSQHLYNLKVEWEDLSNNNSNADVDRDSFVDSKTIKIGFRTIELIQDEREDGRSFYLKVNNISMFMKGSNWIPSHILPEKSAQEARVKELLQSVREANMNMLRVSGGGIYESELFYSLADEYGILIWQDMMFSSAMYPSDNTFLDSVRQEIKEQVRRLQHHPSIALFATNNENEEALRSNWYGTDLDFESFASDYEKLYKDTVYNEIMNNDFSHEVLMSSPSNGNYSGDAEFGIAFFPQDLHYGDIHFYNTTTNAWKSETFPHPRFASAYGFQSFPSDWTELVRDDENSTRLVNHRQHNTQGNNVISFFLEENLRINFESLEWSDKVYLSQLSQAISVKTATEVFRSGRGTSANTMGALYWHLNDVWVAPSCSSVEFNGNFKILHYWIKDIFASQTIITQFASSKILEIFSVSDVINAEVKEVTVKMNLFRLDSFEALGTLNWTYDILPNEVALLNEFDIYEYLTNNSYNVNEVIAEFHLIDNFDNRTLSKSYAIPGKYENLSSVYDPEPELRIVSSICVTGNHSVSLEIVVTKPALFISIDFVHNNLKKYRLSQNGFIQLEAIRKVEISISNPSCRETVNISSFRIHSLNKFLPGYNSSSNHIYGFSKYLLFSLVSILYFLNLNNWFV